MFILGDFNAGNNYLSEGHPTNHSNIFPFEVSLKETIDTLNLVQLIDQPTRITQHTANLRDLIITSNTDAIINSGVLPPFSQIDHFPTFVSLNLTSTPFESTFKQVWDYTNMDSDKLAHLLVHTDWDTLLDHDIDTATTNFTQTLLAAAAESIPTKTIRIRAHDKPWVNTALRREMRKRDRLFRLAQRHKPDYHWDSWRRQRNLTTSLNKQLKDNHLKTQVNILLQAKKNPYEYHRILQHMLGRSRKETVPPLVTADGIPLTNDIDKADLLGYFFVRQSRLETNDIPVPGAVPVDPPPKLDNIAVSEDEVLYALNSIDPNKSTGSDKIPAKLLKMTAIIIKTPLTKLFNMSLSQGVFPTAWKVANVLPIYKKKGSSSDPHNYRPISLLPCVSKVLEKIIFKNIYQHLIENSLLSDKQSGYRPRHNTQVQLIYLINNIYTSLDQGKDFTAIYLDISKYFDKIWHRGLIFKCEKQCGVSGTLLHWLTSYLSNRTQVVKVGNSMSVPRTINAGCPQGSVLGPLLALIYLNDLADKTDNDLLFFADDTTLYTSHTHDPTTAQQSLQRDLDNIQQFGRNWQITFNGTKTIQQTFTNRHRQDPPALTFDGYDIPCETSHKHIGLTISSDMHFHQHVNDIVFKVNRALGPLYPLSKILPRHILNNIYTVYILPLFDYCDAIYDGNLTINDSLRLEKLHNRAARLITGALFRTHTRTLLNDLGWTTLKTRRDIHKLITFHSFVNNQYQLPDDLIALLPGTRAHTTGRPLRNAMTRTLPPNRTTLYQNSFIPSTVRRWNMLPPDVTSLQSSHSFKREIHRRCGAAVPSPYNNLGNRRNNVLHARLRMGLSHLNSHMFQIHSNNTDSASCLCGYPHENQQHFVLTCPLYHGIRTEMLRETLRIIPNFTQLNQNQQLSIYLSGNNLNSKDGQQIANIFQRFILHSKRFATPSGHERQMVG